MLNTHMRTCEYVISDGPAPCTCGYWDRDAAQLAEEEASMHYSKEELEDLRERYVTRFAIFCRRRDAQPPTRDEITKYFDDAIDCDLAAGHYLVEKLRRERAAANRQE